MADSIRVLISNDDGIYAPGLQILEKIARSITDDVWVVAPETEQSGTAHSLTINSPLNLRKLKDQHYAVRGTPTDCVMLAVNYLMKGSKKPDLLLSGINCGANLGEDITYSGTVGAAFEGTVFGIRSIALSQAVKSIDSYGSKNEINWSVSDFYAPIIIEKLFNLTHWPNGILMNVNFPEQMTGDETRSSTQGMRDSNELDINELLDDKGNPFYWIGLRKNPIKPIIDTDFEVISNGNISITPLQINATDYKMYNQLQVILNELK